MDRRRMNEQTSGYTNQHRARWMDSWMNRQANGLTKGQADGQMDKWLDRQAHSKINTGLSRPTGGSTDRCTERHEQTGGWTYRWIYVVIKPEFSKFPKKIKVWSLSSSRCKFSLSGDFVSQKKRRQKVFMSFIEESTAKFADHEVHLRDAMKLLSVEKDRSF